MDGISNDWRVVVEQQYKECSDPGPLTNVKKDGTKGNRAKSAAGVAKGKDDMVGYYAWPVALSRAASGTGTRKQTNLHLNITLTPQLGIYKPA